MNKQPLAMLLLLLAVSGPAQAVDVSANIGWSSAYIENKLCNSNNSCVLADETSIVPGVTRSFGIYPKKTGN
jgi:hypothetical protein